MAKFTVFFKDKVTQSQLFDSGIIRFGRDETNDLIIDNLAVAPAHAVVIIKEDSCNIKQLNDEFPLIVNNEKHKNMLLVNGDTITIGKHTVVYNETELIVSALEDNIDVNNLNKNLEDNIKAPDANLQVLDGPHIGRVLPLKKSMTRIGQSSSGIAVISRRKDGYFISSLEGDPNIIINKEPLAEKTINLKTNDMVIIDDVAMQFFIDT
jgi:pSer/pThr/pTyr-binding forkhead associated (FHA) protein